MESNPSSSPILMKLEFSRHIFEKYSNIKFHENSLSGSQDVPCGRTDRHEQLTVASRQSTNAPKKTTDNNQSMTDLTNCYLNDQCCVLSVELVRFLITVHGRPKCLQGCYLIRKDTLINTMTEPLSA